jgi:hypothetical protein
MNSAIRIGNGVRIAVDKINANAAGFCRLHAMLGAWTFVSVPHFAINIIAATIAKLKLYWLKITLN